MTRWLVTLACFLVNACGNESPDVASRMEATGLRYLGGGSADGFERALEGRRFAFPADHGPHETFRTEWWYFTGNLATSEGRHFGFELTFFRYALPRGAAENVDEGSSGWRTNQFWMAHLAVTDTAANRFVAVERFARQSLGVAGASTEPLRVWVEDWSAVGLGGDGFGVQLSAEDESSGLGLDLRLEGDDDPVLQGDGGFDRKGPSEGNASFYYSLPRLEAQGAIRVDGREFSVEGLAWLDREWSTSALEGDVVGWDWFALQFTDGANLMFYRLRTRDGKTSAFSGGTFVDPNGRRTRLAADDAELTPLREWRSDTTGVRYPVAWRLHIPRLTLDLKIEPYLDQQELVLSVRYWEGAVFADGTGRDGPIAAQGYLELAGY